MFLQIGFYKLHIYLYILAQTEENQHNTLAQMEESQHNTLYQLEDNQYNTLAQLEENQHNTLDQQEENQYNTLDQPESNESLFDLFGLLQMRLAEFLVESFWNFLLVVMVTSFFQWFFLTLIFVHL